MHLKIPELISFCLGVYFIISRAWVAESAAEFDYRAFGLQMKTEWYEMVFLAGGLGFVAIGILSMSGLITLRPLF